MKKVVSLVLAVVMIAMLASVAFAAPSITQWVKVISITEDTKETKVSYAEAIGGAAMFAAIDNAEEGVVPEGVSIKHLTVMRQRNVVNNYAEAIDIVLKVWGTGKKTLCLFWKGVDDEAWSLVACNKGDIIEGTLPGNDGSYAVAMAW